MIAICFTKPTSLSHLKLHETWASKKKASILRSINVQGYEVFFFRDCIVVASDMIDRETMNVAVGGADPQVRCGDRENPDPNEQ